MRKKIILRTWLISLLTALVVAAATVGVLYGTSSRDIRRSLIADAQVYADILTESGADGLDALRAVENWTVRISVFDTAGNPLFDSANGTLSENHIGRIEVQQALAGKSEVVSRFSDTLGTYMLYYAVCSRGNPMYIVRLATPSADVGHFVWLSVPLVIGAAAIALLASYLLARRTGESLSKQMVAVRDGLQSLNEGNYRPIVYAMSDAESYTIVNEMNELFYKMQQQFGELKEERARQEFLLDRISQGVVALDENGNLILFNRAASQLLGKAEKRHNFRVPIDDNYLCERIDEALAAHEDRVIERRYHGRDLVVKVVHTPEGTQRIRALLIVGDVTKELAAVREKSEFFANASHELKTPLTSMQGLSELLLAREDLDERSRRYLERIHGESLRLNRLVLDMLYIDALESDPIVEEAVDLADIVRETAEEYRGEIEAKRLSFEAEGRLDLRIAVRDASALVGNLVGNAVHYNREGGKVRVVMHETEDGAVFEVQDTGIGIAIEDIPHVTERFFRADRSRSKKTGGTGLGLSIVKHAAARYGARLEIESLVGAGSTFRIVFPCSALVQKIEE